MKRLLLTAALVTTALSPLACNLDQLSADKVMVGTILSTPSVDISPAAAAGVDAGVPPDAGTVVTIPGQTAALVFFGTRNSGNSSSFEAISTASVTVQAQGGKATTLTSDGAGFYTRTSQGDPELKYQPNATYDFVATQGTERFVGQVENAPPQERVDALHPPEGVLRLSANEPFTFNRKTLAAGEKRTIGLVTVVPVSDNGNQGDPTYTNAPKTPGKFLELVSLPDEWMTDKVTIPASAFPQRNANYLIIFQSVRTGGPESNNLFVGSAMLAGAADVGVVRTK